MTTKILTYITLCFLICSCSQNEITRYQEYNFLDLLDDATITGSAKEYVNPSFHEIAGQTNWAIFQHAPSMISFPEIIVGDNPALDFSISILPGAWQNSGDGVRFIINAQIDDATFTVYEKYIDPKKNETERNWIEERIVLNNLAKKNVVFQFKTEIESNDESDWAVWGNPRLISDGLNSTNERITSKPNFLVITLDTVRFDYLGCYQNEWVQTPQMNYFSQKGITFDQAYTTMPTTSPAHASLLTSVYPNLHQVISNLYKVPQALPQLPQILHEDGYTNGASISVKHLNDSISGLGRWFDFYSDIKEDRLSSNDFFQLTRSADVTTSAAIRWLEQFYDQPFFLWLQYYDAHAPYKAPGEFHKMYYDGDPKSRVHTSMQDVILHDKWDESAIEWTFGYTDLDFFIKEYGAEITYIDSQIARLWKTIEDLKVDDDTYVIITADHGENLGEHKIYFDHWTMFNTDIQIPLIIYHKTKLPKGLRISTPVSIVDIAPTILSLIEENHSSLLDKTVLANGFQGNSLKPLWENNEESVELANNNQHAEGLLYTSTSAWNDQYKLIWELRWRKYHKDLLYYPDKVSVYDVKKDPAEENPIGVFRWKKIDQKEPPVVWEINELPSHQEETKVTTLVEKTRSRIDQKALPDKEHLIDWFNPELATNETKDMIFLDPSYPDNDPAFYDKVINLMEQMLINIQTKDLQEYLFETGVFTTPLDNPDLLEAIRLPDEALEGMPSYVDH